MLNTDLTHAESESSLFLSVQYAYCPVSVLHTHESELPGQKSELPSQKSDLPSKKSELPGKPPCSRLSPSSRLLLQPTPFFRAFPPPARSLLPFSRPLLLLQGPIPFSGPLLPFLRVLSLFSGPLLPFFRVLSLLSQRRSELLPFSRLYFPF